MTQTTRSFPALVLVALLSGCEQLAPARPATLTLVEPIGTTAPAGTPITSISVRVRDQYGVVMAGQPLTVVTTTGSVTNVATQTVSGGGTPIGIWTLAQASGLNILRITSGTLPELTISIAGVAGPAAKINATLPGTATVGRTINIAFTVLDAFDNPLAATILSASADAGVVPVPAAVTDGTGTATLSWVLGTTRGTQTLTAGSGGVNRSFQILTVADIPQQLNVTAGSSQVGLAAVALPVRPQVMLSDAYGNPTSGRTVTFSVALGGGSLSGSLTATTDNNGVATGPTWTLGRTITPQRLNASSSGFFVPITATVNPGIPITLRYFGAGTEPFQPTFLAATTRLRAMIVSGAPAEAVNDLVLSGTCGVTGADNISETITGVLVYAGVVTLDGVGGNVSRTTICATRGAAGNYQPLVASVVIDADDVAGLTVPLSDLIAHELLHALGFGNVWALNALVDATLVADPRYTGPNGLLGCVFVSASACTTGSVPVEAGGGVGIAGVHWREVSFLSEMMTGFLGAEGNPISRMTVQAMRDLGYTVNPAAADEFSSAIRALPPNGSILSEHWERIVNASPALRAGPPR